MISISNLVNLIGRLRVIFGILRKGQGKPAVRLVPRKTAWKGTGQTAGLPCPRAAIFIFQGAARGPNDARKTVSTTTEAILTTIVVRSQREKSAPGRGVG